MLFNHWRFRSGTLLAVGVILIAAIALGLALLARRQLAIEVRLEGARANALRQALQVGARENSPTCSAEVGYVQTLPSSVSLDKLVQSLQDSAKAFDVSVKSVSGEPRAMTAQTLATLDVNIAIHGGYPGIKAALAEGLSRFPTGTLTHLHLKRDGATLPPLEDATARVMFALQPVVSAPLDCNLAAYGADAREALK